MHTVASQYKKALSFYAYARVRTMKPYGVQKFISGMPEKGMIVMNGPLDTSAIYHHRQNRVDVRSIACMNVDCSDRAERARRLTEASIFNMYRA